MNEFDKLWNNYKQNVIALSTLIVALFTIATLLTNTYINFKLNSEFRKTAIVNIKKLDNNINIIQAKILTLTTNNNINSKNLNINSKELQQLSDRIDILNDTVKIELDNNIK